MSRIPPTPLLLSSPARIPEILSYDQDAESRAALEPARDTAEIEEKQAEVKTGICRKVAKVAKACLIDTALRRLVQQFVGIVSLARFVSGIADERLNFTRI